MQYTYTKKISINGKAFCRKATHDEMPIMILYQMSSKTIVVKYESGLQSEMKIDDPDLVLTPFSLKKEKKEDKSKMITTDWSVLSKVIESIAYTSFKGAIGNSDPKKGFREIIPVIKSKEELTTLLKQHITPKVIKSNHI